MSGLLEELERLHSRAEEARRKAARAEAVAEHKRVDLAQLAESLRSEYGIESWDQAGEWLEQAERDAEQALAQARELMEAEGI